MIILEILRRPSVLDVRVVSFRSRRKRDSKRSDEFYIVFWRIFFRWAFDFNLLS